MEDHTPGASSESLVLRPPRGPSRSDLGMTRGPDPVTYVGRVDQLRAFLRGYGFDLLVVVAAVESALETAFRPDPASWFAVIAVGIVVLSLLGRRRFAFAAPAALWLAVAVLSFIDGRLVTQPAGVFLAGMTAAFLLGNVPEAVKARLGLAVVLAGAAVIVYNLPERAAGEFVFTPLLFAVAWLAGFALRERAAQAEAAEARALQAERDREAAARLAVAEERARIARELHDVVAHAVSLMVLQVGAVRHKMPESSAQDHDALQNVEQVGRTALAEMRSLLGAMRHDGEPVDLAPQPGLGDLEALLADVRAAGLPVRMHVEGEPRALPRAIDLSAYRIVQEGLTNALKHARAGQADVAVRYGADDVQVEVVDDGRGASTDDGVGHGLIGIKERVKIFGGDLKVGTAGGGGFVLRARLPLNGHTP
jgi:signal transduction histidine kinase